MRRIWAKILGVMGLLGVLAGCAVTSGPGPGSAGAAPAASGRSASPASTSAAPLRATSGGVRNLVVSPAVRAELTTAYAAYRGIPVTDIAGTRTGSVYYGYDPATYTYWAEAGFEPSSTAPAQVLVNFQDGGSIGLFSKITNGRWQVRLGDEPPVCTEVAFFPPAVLTLWRISASTAGTGCHPQPPRPAPTRPVTSAMLAATISIPATWSATPYLGWFGYDGASGWMMLNAEYAPGGLHHACTVTASGNPLRPFGRHPQIIYRSIDGRPGCLIFPSSDAAAHRPRNQGPVFSTGAALVEYRRPISAGGSCISASGQPCLYSMLEIDADPAHLGAIADSVRLHH